MLFTQKAMELLTQHVMMSYDNALYCDCDSQQLSQLQLDVILHTLFDKHCPGESIKFQIISSIYRAAGTRISRKHDTTEKTGFINKLASNE